ncbi:MAG TPA: ABC transporter permease [Streptosporangiaceae bacterium]|nr:ABC transporter permease [Streptosporangiaceae bacterium]
MLRYTARRVGALIFLAIGISIIAFSILRLIPGSPAQAILGTSGTSKAELARLNAQLGLNRPLVIQYLSWVGDALRGNFGYSYSQKQPVSSLLAQNIPPTLELIAVGMVLTVVFGMLIGVGAALRRGRLTDTALMAGSVVFLSLPSFWLGQLLIQVFAVQVHLFPVVGGTGLAGLTLPAVTLALGGIGLTARFVRSSVIEAAQQPHVVIARAKGVSRGRILLGHVIRNSLLPVINIVGLQFGSLLSGVVIVEEVFSRNGLGRLLVDSILSKDYPTVQAVVLLIAVTYCVVTLLVDLAYRIIDPRTATR